MVYVAVISVCAFVLPRLERSCLASLTIDIAVVGGYVPAREQGQMNTGQPQ